MVDTRRCWSDLPSELLEKIGKLLTDCRIHVSMFRAVCRSWRLSLAPYKKQVFPPIVYRKNNAVTLTFTLSVDTFVYHLTTPPVEDDEDNQKLERDNWFVKVTNGKTPQLLNNQDSTALAPLPKELNTLEFRVTELPRVYSLSTSSNNILVDCKVANQRVYSLSTSSNNKLLDCKVAKSSVNADCPELMFVIKPSSSTNVYGLTSGLYHCKLVKDNEMCYFCCTRVNNSLDNYPLQDVIFHRGKFYAVGRNGCTTLTLVVASPSNTSPLEFETCSLGISHLHYGRPWLNKSLGELFLVATPPSSRGIKFMVFQMNAVEKKWVPIYTSEGDCREDLKDVKLLFVGDDHVPQLVNIVRLLLSSFQNLKLLERSW